MNHGAFSDGHVTVVDPNCPCWCPSCSILHLYLAVVRPVIEFAAPVWHHSLYNSQTNRVEAIEKRAIRIIYSYTCDMPYTSAFFVAVIASLADRMDLLSYSFFKNIMQPTSCLHYLVLPPRDAELLSDIRAPLKFPRFLNWIKKYQSFMSYRFWLSVVLVCFHFVIYVYIMSLSVYLYSCSVVIVHVTIVLLICSI